jgi:hypothetical protein
MIQPMDNVLIVVDQTVGLDDVRADIAMMRSSA